MSPVRDKNFMIFKNMFNISSKKSPAVSSADFTTPMGGLSLTG